VSDIIAKRVLGVDMAMKDVPDSLVCCAVQQFLDNNRSGSWPYELLAQWTGQPEKVCYRAMERAATHGLIEWGVSLRTGWLTDKGKSLI